MPLLPSSTELGLLPSRSSHASSGNPLCSIVIAARDEVQRIEQTVHQLLAQKGVELEIVVVDDRSTDGTSEILGALQKRDGRLRVIRVDELPDGWLGKCHACHIGARQTRGDWILFTDADCWFKPDLLMRALTVAGREAADHLTMTPAPLLESHAARGWYLLFLSSLAGWFWGVNSDRPASFMGIGAFNLVRSTVYRRSGGYEALRLTVLDDVKLGLLIRRAGGRTRAFLAGQDLECHWGSSVRHLVRILEKNYFAALDYRVEVVLAGGTLVLCLMAILVIGMFSGTLAGTFAGLSPLLLVPSSTVLARRMGWTWHSAWFMPLMVPVFYYTLLNSTWTTLRQGGIRWRETFYSLRTLREGNLR